ncbi:calcineurin-like phosphoesterase protein [Rutstroemia sp. NJR-2017a BVV2]|nr:calcineurin-like phosphoesterase protein [Rutstroemia sp. NJR-2017a BVV2]
MGGHNTTEQLSPHCRQVRKTTQFHTSISPCSNMPESSPSPSPPESAISPNRIPHPPPRMRKTRFVCISDTHNASAPSSFQLPRGDVLLHAGDLTNQGSFSELQKTLKWIEDADFEAKIIVAGNHDTSLDSEFPTQHQQSHQHSLSLSLLTSSPSILYLSHSGAEINLLSPTGPHTTFRIFGSPFSPASASASASASSPWGAFSYPPPSPIWNAIPLDTDIFITHTPPHSHLDARSDARPVGCEDLRKALWRVRPRLAVCGHVHEGRGAEIVRWDLEGKEMYGEESVRRWEDPGRGNKKMSVVDLSARSGFENDGAGVGDWKEGESSDGMQVVVDGEAEQRRTLLAGASTNLDADLDSDAKPRQRDKYRPRRSLAHINPHPNPDPSITSFTSTSTSFSPPPPSSPSDPLSNRLGRKETCIVNAAIMGRSWPHSGSGPGGRGKTFNKPIVVDIDLPVWE